MNVVYHRTMQLHELLVALSVATTVTAWSPTDSYAPGNVTCDDDINLVRNASDISSLEKEWLKKRDANTKEALRSFFERTTSNFSDTSFIDTLFGDDDSKLPRVAIAASGGGYRAMLAGAGMVAAMDNRTRGADEHGLGGLLQGSTYLAGLSGGNWMTGTLAWNNWTSIQEIIDNLNNNGSIWDLHGSLMSPGGTNTNFTNERFANITKQVAEKQEAGFNTSLVDAWGRLLSYYFFPTVADAGLAYTWSTLRDVDVFQNAEMPFPISVVDSRYPNDDTVALNSTIFEFNPFEIGSWDPTLHAFSDVKYLGTKVSNGKPVNEGQCIAGFDNVGLIMGTSSDLFNMIENSPSGAAYSGIVRQFTTMFLPNATGNDTDIGIYAPNPFKDTNFIEDGYTTGLSETDDLFLVDGGENGEGVPFAPLVRKERSVDIIFALDNSDNTDENYPDGTDLINTYSRQFTKEGKGSAFPYVPDRETFIKEGLNERPTFFGCDGSNTTGLEYVPPLIVYVPNKNYTFNSGTSTFKLAYTKNETLGMIQNGFEAITRNNLTDDSSFASCISCAIMKRKQEDLNIELPKECEQCFSTYCWGGYEVSVSNSTTNSSNTVGYSNTTSLVSNPSIHTSVVSGASSMTNNGTTSTTSKTKQKNAGDYLNVPAIGQTLGLVYVMNGLFNLL